MDTIQSKGVHPGLEIRILFREPPVPLMFSFLLCCENCTDMDGRERTISSFEGNLKDHTHSLIWTSSFSLLTCCMVRSSSENTQQLHVSFHLVWKHTTTTCIISPRLKTHNNYMYHFTLCENTQQLHVLFHLVWKHTTTTCIISPRLKTHNNYMYHFTLCENTQQLHVSFHLVWKHTTTTVYMYYFTSSENTQQLHVSFHLMWKLSALIADLLHGTILVWKHTTTTCIISPHLKTHNYMYHFSTLTLLLSVHQ